MRIVRDRNFWPLSQTECPVGFQIFVTMTFSVLLLDRNIEKCLSQETTDWLPIILGRMILPRKRQDEHAKDKSRKVRKIIQ